MRSDRFTACLLATVALVPASSTAQYYYEQPYEYQYYAPAPRYYIPQAPHLSGDGPMPALPVIERRTTRRIVTPRQHVQPSPLIIRREQFMARPAASVAPEYNPEQVLAAQKQLNELGYPAGTADGKMGVKTRAAIESFKQDRKISDARLLGPATIAALSKAVSEREAMPSQETQTISIASKAPEEESKREAEPEPEPAPVSADPHAGGAAPATASGGEPPLSANPFFNKEREAKVTPITSASEASGIRFSFND